MQDARADVSCVDFLKSIGRTVRKVNVAGYIENITCVTRIYQMLLWICLCLYVYDIYTCMSLVFVYM